MISADISLRGFRNFPTAQPLFIYRILIHPSEPILTQYCGMNNLWNCVACTEYISFRNYVGKAASVKMRIPRLLTRTLPLYSQL
jgi:hypothetical protein